MTIKEQIESLLGLLDDELPTFLPANEPKPLTVADLKALAASHDRLIRNLRVMASAAEHKSDLLPESFKIAWNTIEEAEKL